MKCHYNAPQDHQVSLSLVGGYALGMQYLFTRLRFALTLLIRYWSGRSCPSLVSQASSPFKEAFGSALNPLYAPSKPPTIQAFVSVSPPMSKVS